MTAFSNLKAFFQYPADKKYEAEIEQHLVQDALSTYKMLCIVILCMQSFMILTFLFKEGGPFSTPRRSGYFILYFMLLIPFSVFLFLLKKWERSGGRFNFLRYEIYVAAYLCLWSCMITFLDQFGGNGLIVYCYMMPTTAVFCIIKPWQSVAVYGVSCLFLNAILPLLPGGTNNLFSNMVNSIFITLISILVSINLYHYRIVSLYNKLIMLGQYDEICRMNEALNRIALTDQLTQLYNRRYLTDTIYQKLTGREYDGMTVAGVMLDIDHFKQYNDTYGHLEGDACLKKIAAELNKYNHTDNYYALRYGGEEFFIIVPGLSREEGMELAEYLRLTIYNLNIPHSSCPEKRITVSVGIAADTLSPGFNLKKFMECADSALYHAKRTGRNRSVLYTPGMHSESAT